MSVLSPSRESRAGFAALLHDVATSARRAEKLGDACESLLTLGGRMAVEHGRAALTDEELAVVDEGAELAVDRLQCAPERIDRTWHISLQPLGRVSVSRNPSTADRIPVCRVTLPDSVEARVARRTRAASGERDALEAEIDRFIASLSRRDDLHRVLDSVVYGIDHIDQVLFHVGEETFSNLPGFNTLLHRPEPQTSGYLLSSLYHKPPESWTWAERQFVFCFYAIRRTGGRGEEFNGRQLTAVTLRRHLEERRREYRADHDEESAPAPGTSIADLVDQVAVLRPAWLKSRYVTRWIQGLTFYKEEQWLPQAPRADLGALSVEAKTALGSQFGVRPQPGESADDVLRRAVDAALTVRGFGTPSASMNGIERLLLTLVECAMHATGSDVAMSRGLRDLNRWGCALDDEQYRDMCEWPITDYFCAVTAAATYTQSLPSAKVSKMLLAIARRMQYNSWHFMPSYFPVETVPRGRHFFFAPVFCDRAEWSDQHHPGHVLVGARYTVRVPLQLVHRDKGYPGMTDLRLMRKEGPGFTEEELQTACVWAEFLRVVYQHFVDRQVAGAPALRIDAFTDTWYRAYGEDLVACRSSLQSTAQKRVA
jgi:hypothetical protein